MSHAPDVPATPASAGDDLPKVEWITTEKRLLELTAEWDALSSRFACAIETMPTFCLAWWRHALATQKQRRTLFVIAVRCEGSLVAVFPLQKVEHRAFGIVSVRILRGIGDELFVPLIDPEKREVAWDAFYRQLRLLESRWDIIDMKGVDPTSKELSPIAASADRHDLSLTEYEEEIRPVLELPSTFHDYLVKRSKNFRFNLKRKLKKSEAFGAIEYECVAAPAEFEKAFPDFIALHQSRRNAVGDDGIFSCGDFTRYYSDLHAKLIEKGAARLFFVKLAGRRVACVLAHEYQGCLSLVLSGMESQPEILKLGVGNLLDAYIIEYSIQTGIKRLDYGAGAQPYKYELGAADRKVYHFTVTRGRRAPFKRGFYLLDQKARQSVRLVVGGFKRLFGLARRYGPFSVDVREYLARALRLSKVFLIAIEI